MHSALAPPGGICITAQVHASVLNKVDFGFESQGIPKLKNVTTPVEVFRIIGYGKYISIPATVGAVPPGDRIAVLPFTNISQDQADEYFADRLTEELISPVSEIHGLRVIARTSVMRYKGTSKPISEIGRELNVGSILEGSVRKSGNKLRISVQLVETANEEQSWYKKYDREIEDVFTIQSEISRKVAEALRDHVTGGISRHKEERVTRST